MNKTSSPKSPVPKPVDGWPVLDDYRTCTSVELSQDWSATDPVEKFKLSTLDVDVVSVSFHVPSFPWSDVGSPVDGGSVVACTDVFTLSQGFEGPWTVDLLFPDEKLAVCWRACSWSNELEVSEVGSQVAFSLLEREIFKLFASIANIAKVSLGVEESGG